MVVTLLWRDQFDQFAQRQIMMCGATKLRRQRERAKKFAFGVDTQLGLPLDESCVFNNQKKNANAKKICLLKVKRQV
jgi:hypothetical protein